MIVQNIKVTVDAIVFRKHNGAWQLLVVKRKYDPDKGMWAMPGGFVEDDEELEVAAMRELEEETGLKLTSMTQMHSFGKVGRDTRGRNVSVAYVAILEDGGQEVKGADDAEEACWINIDDLKEMAFDHMDMLAMARKFIKE